MDEKLFAILQAQGLEYHLSKFTDQGVSDSILGDLSDSDLKVLGIEKLGERKRLLLAFSIKDSRELDTQISTNADPVPPSTSIVCSPSEATKDEPFINSLGMPFVPIPRFDTQFCIWPVRVQDYESYCSDTGAQFPACPFTQEGDHPIVGITWRDANDFCKWLTKRERSEEKIDKQYTYRLPTDLEWSAAVGLPHEPESNPAERHLKAPSYPWGLRWPPPMNAGNYEGERKDQLGIFLDIRQAEDCQRTAEEIIAEDGSDNVSLKTLYDAKRRVQEHHHRLNEWIKSWRPVDNFDFTSPVASFSANQFGIFDLGGNVWEWCLDSRENAKPATIDIENTLPNKVLRGGSFFISPRDSTYNVILNNLVYRSSFRHSLPGNQVSRQEIFEEDSETCNSYPDGGFRVVLAHTGNVKKELMDFLGEHRDKFSKTNLFNCNNNINESDGCFQSMLKHWEAEEGINLLKIGEDLRVANLKQLEEAQYEEAFWQISMEGNSKIKDEFIGELYHEYLIINPVWANLLRYRYARMICSEFGVGEEVRTLLLEHFNQDPKLLEQLGVDIDHAIRDEELLPLRDFLEEIRTKIKGESGFVTALKEPPALLKPQPHNRAIKSNKKQPALGGVGVASEKKVWIAFLLVFIFGLFGYFYTSWKRALVLLVFWISCAISISYINVHNLNPLWLCVLLLALLVSFLIGLYCFYKTLQMIFLRALAEALVYGIWTLLFLNISWFFKTCFYSESYSLKEELMMITFWWILPFAAILRWGFCPSLILKK